MRAAVLNRITIVLSLFGLAIAGALSLDKFKNIVPPCGLVQGCERVLTHASSTMLGLPTAFYGFLAYAAILGIATARALLGVERTARLGLISYWITLVGSMVSLGLQIYSGTVIHSWCVWCITSAITMILLLITQATLYQSLAGTSAEEPGVEVRARREVWDWGAIGIGVALFVAVLLYHGSGKGVETVAVSAALAPKLIPDDANMRGPKDAPVTIVEFGDLCCPSCKRAYADLDSMFLKYNGRLRLVFRHFPLFEMHKQAYRAAVYAEYAGTKGHFFDFVDRAYQSNEEQSDQQQTFENILLGLGMDVGEAEKQYQDKNSAAFSRVYRDYDMANALGIAVTPTFFLVVTGEQPYSIKLEDLKAQLESNEKYTKLLRG